MDQNLTVAIKAEEIMDGLDPLGENEDFDVDYVKAQPQSNEVIFNLSQDAEFTKVMIFIIYCKLSLLSNCTHY